MHKILIFVPSHQASLAPPPSVRVIDQPSNHRQVQKHHQTSNHGDISQDAQTHIAWSRCSKGIIHHLVYRPSDAGKREANQEPVNPVSDRYA